MIFYWCNEQYFINLNVRSVDPIKCAIKPLNNNKSISLVIKEKKEVISLTPVKN